MRAYEIIPIDFGWENLQTVGEVASRIGAAEGKARAEGFDPATDPALSEFLSLWEAAKRLASDAGWEGDFREDPRVFWLPEENRFAPGFVFKQDNNGTTYVVTPHDLAHLDRLT